jgi:excisionase family DNA binding protein
MKMLTTAEVAALLGITVSRVQSLIWEGRLPAQKRGRDFFIREVDVALVADRAPGRKRKEGVAELVKRVGLEFDGLLVPNCVLLDRDRPQTRARQVADGVVLEGERTATWPAASRPSLREEQVVILDASPHRLGTALLTRAFFHLRLALQQSPAAARAVAVCGSVDDFLWSNLGEIFAGVYLKIIPELGSSIEPVPTTDRERLQHYHTKFLGGRHRLIENYVLKNRSRDSARQTAHAVLVLGEGGYPTVRKDLPLRGRDVVVLHSTTRRLNTAVIGRALLSDRVIRKEQGPRSLSSVILCQETDTALESLLQPYGIQVLSDDKTGYRPRLREST